MKVSYLHLRVEPTLHNLLDTNEAVTMASLGVQSHYAGAFKFLFVYGTLKSGYTNYTRYLLPALKLGRAFKVGRATTIKRYPLILRPADRPPKTRGPILMQNHAEPESSWHHIQGELYKVDDLTMRAMDILEGVHKTNQYFHEKIEVRLLNSEKNDIKDEQIQCTCYFFGTSGIDDSLLNVTPLLSCYDDQAHEQYQPSKDVNREILKLIYSGTVTCRRCKKKYVTEYNNSSSCRHHSESFAGETKQRWQVPGDTDGSAEIHFFYSCCGNYNIDSEGCHVSKHVSYDEDDIILYKDYE